VQPEPRETTRHVLSLPQLAAVEPPTQTGTSGAQIIRPQTVIYVNDNNKRLVAALQKGTLHIPQQNTFLRHISSEAHLL